MEYASHEACDLLSSKWSVLWTSTHKCTEQRSVWKPSELTLWHFSSLYYKRRVIGWLSYGITGKRKWETSFASSAVWVPSRLWALGKRKKQAGLQSRCFTVEWGRWRVAGAQGLQSLDEDTHKLSAAGPNTNPQAVCERNLDYIACFCFCCCFSWCILFLWEGRLLSCGLGFGIPSEGHMLKGSSASGSWWDLRDGSFQEALSQRVLTDTIDLHSLLWQDEQFWFLVSSWFWFIVSSCWDVLSHHRLRATGLINYGPEFPKLWVKIS